MTIKLLDCQEMSGLFTGSGIGFFDTNLYVTDTDATRIIVMDKGWRVLDAIELEPSDASRMPAGIKAQFTAVTVIQSEGENFLLMLGSGAVEDAPYKGILMNIQTESMEELDLSEFYHRIRLAGFETIDITAVTVLGDKLILSNRNKARTDNHIIITSLNFWKDQANAEITPVKIEFEQKPDAVMTLQGLTYSYMNDWLMLTASSGQLQQQGEEEQTMESYLAVIENASRKIDRKRIKTNILFKLSDVNENFMGHQVASVCLQADKEQKLKLHLVAENSNGESSFFKIRLKE